jgi:hypothetical protein
MPDRPLLLAVLIDADNVSAGSAEAILKEIATLGEPGLRRVYGDWSSPALGKWKTKALDLGLVMHQQSANTKGKNASDIGLVIDAMDILHGGRFDGFVLVSSDSDFTRLASRIREDGRQVIGIGEGKTPEALRNVCNRFILIENIIGDDSTPTRDEARPARAKEPATAVIPLVVKAMQTIDPEGEWYGLGVVGQTILQANPAFDPRTYGAAKLSDLLRKVSRFEVRQGGTGNRLEVRDRA